MFVQEMTREECVALASAGRLGRLACARDNRPYVVPIHYTFADNYLYGFSMPGQKVDWMRTNPKRLRSDRRILRSPGLAKCSGWAI